eukprot:10259694-Alexandrium_andersonii.AAC.1
MCIRDREREEEDEELEELPGAEKELDPFNKAIIGMVIDDTMVYGHAQDIVCGKTTKERLYLVKYTD